MTTEIESLYTHRTYAGCLEGIVDPEVIIKKTKSIALKMFGEHRPIVILDPVLTDVPAVELFEGGKLLPKWTNIAYCSGPAIRDEDHGTHCVVVWFSDGPVIADGSNEIFQKFDWDKKAKGWCA